MDYPGNNLFQFATKELSQDAMICWLINNFNYPEQDKELYQLSIKLVRSLLGGKAPDKIESVRILQQYNSIDVLLIVNQRIAVIVEDKVWSSEHGDQIKKYRESVERELANPNSRKALLGVDVEQSETAIVTVYFKTGFWYDNDILTGSRVDVCVTGKDFLALLKQCHSTHPFFVDFAYRLEHVILQEYVDTRKEFDARDWERCGSKYYAQYLILDSMFPNHGKNLTPDEQEYVVKRIYGGSNRDGTPWNEYTFWCALFPEKYVIKHKKDEPEKERHEYCSLFWRIDKNKEGLYVSLRHYDAWAKEDDFHANRKKQVYKYFCNQVDNIAKHHELLKYLAPRGKGENYKESTLLTMYLTSSIEDHAHTLEDIQYVVAEVTKELLNPTCELAKSEKPEFIKAIKIVRELY